MHAEFSDSSVVMMAAVVVLKLTYFPLSLEATCVPTASRGARTRRHVFIVHVAWLQPGGGVLADQRRLSLSLLQREKETGAARVGVPGRNAAVCLHCAHPLNLLQHQKNV